MVSKLLQVLEQIGKHGFEIFQKVVLAFDIMTYLPCPVRCLANALSP